MTNFASEALREKAREMEKVLSDLKCMKEPQVYDLVPDENGHDVHVAAEIPAHIWAEYKDEIEREYLASINELYAAAEEYEKYLAGDEVRGE